MDNNTHVHNFSAENELFRHFFFRNVAFTSSTPKQKQLFMDFYLKSTKKKIQNTQTDVSVIRFGEIQFKCHVMRLLTCSLDTLEKKMSTIRSNNMKTTIQHSWI